VKSLFVLLLLVGMGAFASDLEVDECVGCHTARRNEPKSRFANGLGHWNDSQCYGCHAELNDVAARHQKGQEDRRYYAVPVREEKLAGKGKLKVKMVLTSEGTNLRHVVEGEIDLADAHDT